MRTFAGALGWRTSSSRSLTTREICIRSAKYGISTEEWSMNIARVDAIPVADTEPNDSNSTRSLLFCRIETTDGVIGWGEAITQFPEASRSAAVLLEGLSDTLIGRDPLDHQSIFSDLDRRSWWYTYEGGIGAFVLSALDIALWDLRGKILGQPVSVLLGGALRPELDRKSTRLNSSHLG